MVDGAVEVEEGEHPGEEEERPVRGGGRGLVDEDVEGVGEEPATPNASAATRHAAAGSRPDQAGEFEHERDQVAQPEAGVRDALQGGNRHRPAGLDGEGGGAIIQVGNAART